MRHAEKTQKKKSWWSEWGSAILVPFIIVLLLRIFVVGVFAIPSGSMENTIEIGQRVLTWKFDTHPGRGDVEVFDDKYDWLDDGDDKPGELIKRVIGVGGDRVTYSPESEELRVNGVKIEEPYVANGYSGSMEIDVTVPDGKYYVLGDNRNNSADSRFHSDVNGGFVDQDQIEGVVMMTYWPFDRVLGKVNYPEVFKDVK